MNLMFMTCLLKNNRTPLDYNIDTRRLIEEICNSLIPGIRQSNINNRLLGIGISNFPGDGNKPSQLILDF